MTDSINQSVNNKGVCRTAPATHGLLNILVKILAQIFKISWNSMVVLSFHEVCIVGQSPFSTSDTILFKYPGLRIVIYFIIHLRRWIIGKVGPAKVSRHITVYAVKCPLNIQPPACWPLTMSWPGGQVQPHLCFNNTEKRHMIVPDWYNRISVYTRNYCKSSFFLNKISMKIWFNII